MIIFVLQGTHAPPLVTWLSPLADATHPRLSCLQTVLQQVGPPPDSMPAPDLETMCSLLAKHLKQLKGSSSSGLGTVASPFLKHAYEPGSESRGFDGVHVLLPLLAQIFPLSFESARVQPLCTRRAPCLTPTAIACWRSVAPCTDCTQMSFAPYLQLGASQKARYRANSLVSTQARTLNSPCSSLGTCSTLPAPLSQPTLPGCTLPSLTSIKPKRQSLNRLFGFISVAYACLHLSSLPSKPVCW